GDTFTVSVADAVGKFIPCVKTASDGSQVPVAVLVDYTDASAADARAGGYFMGEFNANAIICDDSWTPAQLAAAMPNGLFLKGAVIAADPGTATPVTP
ncbi:head decoration protein, partial [Thioclava sp. BHET1]